VMGRTEGAIKSLYHRTLLVMREEMVNEPKINITDNDGK
jgi:hypothetical protein